MIITDGLHLVGTDEKELHAFAKKIGLKREWFQDKHRIPHYDIFTRLKIPSKFSQKLHYRARVNGAIYMTSRQLIETYRNSLKNRSKQAPQENI
jgi:hypothetical protein